MAKKNPFLDNYKKEMLPVLKKSYPNLSDEQILAYLDKKIAESEVVNDKEESITIRNTYNDDESMSCNLLDLLNFYLKSKPITTGYGVMYKNHYEAENLNAGFVQYLMSERKVYKKIQFEGLNTGNEILEAFGEMMQKTFKLLNNSYYGVTGEKNSQFYDENTSASITYTGYQIITSSILGFEMLLANNVKYNNISELLIYLGRIIKDIPKTPIFEVLDKDKIVSKKTAYNYVLENLIDYEPSKEDIDKIKNLINNCTKEEYNRIYYKNNIYPFLENTCCSTLLSTIVKEKVQNPAEISDDLKEIVDLLWNLLKEYVVYDYSIFNRALRCLTMDRENILTIDTDSNFLYLDKYFNWCKDLFDIDIEEEINRFSIINSAVLFLSKYIQNVLNRFTENCNVPEEKQPIINMKNEFYYPRILLTRNKKQYAGLLRLQEGNIIEPSKIDMKGMSIKKANVCARTRKVFTKLIENKILKDKNISLSGMLNYFLSFEDEIRESLMKGETTFLTPGKVNDIKSYKTPERMPMIRGAIIWDELYPDNNIQTPAKVNMLKLKSQFLDDLKSLEGTEEYNIIYNTIFKPIKKDTPNPYEKYGFTSISFPKNVEKIPDWLIPFIDIEAIIDDNIRTGLLLLESLGFNLMNYNNKEYFSTFIKF